MRFTWLSERCSEFAEWARQFLSALRTIELVIRLLASFASWRNPMRRMTKRFRRRKKRFIWTGVQTGSTDSQTVDLDIPDVTQSTPQGNDVPWMAGPGLALAVEIVGPSALSLATDLLLHRVLFGFTVSNPSEFNGVLLQMQLEVVQSTNDEWPIITPPDFDDLDAWQKRLPMWNGAWYIGPGASIGMGSVGGICSLNNGNPYDIGVKRKMRGDEQLVMKFGMRSTVGELLASGVLNHFWARALVSGGVR